MQSVRQMFQSLQLFFVEQQLIHLETVFRFDQQTVRSLRCVVVHVVSVRLQPPGLLQVPIKLLENLRTETTTDRPAGRNGYVI